MTIIEKELENKMIPEVDSDSPKAIDLSLRWIDANEDYD